jgi:hypothetical protein
MDTHLTRDGVGAGRNESAHGLHDGGIIRTGAGIVHPEKVEKVKFLQN